MLSAFHILLAIPLLSLVVPPARAYIPAVPINDTSGLNLTDGSEISIAWTNPLGVYSGKVSYQLEADVPTGGQTSGALVHFTEGKMGPNISTGTPWIAYISCDANETGASQEWDIFTLARDRGAVSALLYTATSQTCLLTEEYIMDFEKPLDVFATKTVQVARVIDNQWSHTNDTFYYFNSTLLNESSIDVNNSLSGDPPAWKTYLIGTLTARNSTGQAEPTDIPNATASPDPQAHSKGPSSSMIALYVIVGLISACFLLMIIIGASRALRHPERYGRRAATDEQGPQSAAHGLGQAILDTFPVIKFNRRQPSPTAERRRTSPHPDHEKAASPSLQRSLSNVESSAHVDRTSYYSTLRRVGTSVSLDDGISTKMSSASPSTSRRASRLDLQRAIETPTAHMAGARRHEGAADEQCPICLLDFEIGDDLRVLPCEIGHVYHQACIDPWLLHVSSSCPLCRKDFNPPPAESPSNPTNPDSPPLQSGFPRYLAFMRRQGRGRSRANTGTTEQGQVGRGRRREADQTGPGGY